ncbi:MAG: LysM peptidoglycan-binding domain-containing protein [Kiritimatiellae bacterium]|nr:LysM peptidoglycan-binding domain-containing protein [Kiritimatiellia bacterium]
MVAEVNQAIAASDKRTEAAIKSALAQARSSGGGGGGGSSRGSSRPTDGGQYYEHKVGSGQTVSEIARAYGVTVADIARANNLKAPNYVIRENQTLWIPAR